MKAYRSEVVKLAQSWVGLREADGSYKKIIDTYNSYNGAFPRSLKMNYGWAWCACTWSALAIKLGYTDIMPIEISCMLLIEEAKKMNIWKEDDGYIPSPGDAILYDWDDNGTGDCTGWADHVGVVEKVNEDAGYMVVIEGNYSDSVKRRTISINGKYIRGFITPKYSAEITQPVSKPEDGTKKTNLEIAREVIAGDWGSGDKRKKKLEKAGYDYKLIQNAVNYILNEKNVSTCKKSASLIQPIKKRVYASTNPKKSNTIYEGIYCTTANVYCRNGAGTNKKALCLIPKDASVISEGEYSKDSSGNVWLVITCIIDGVLYIGYTHKKYLKFEQSNL